MIRAVFAMLVLTVTCLVQPATAGQYENATAAYKRGDYSTSLRLLQPLASRGDVRAQFRLAKMYFEGRGALQNFAEAAKWYRRAAEQGYGKAQVNLGTMYYAGQGVAQDYVEAAKWFRKAAEGGNAEAQDNLGLMYEDGRGVAQDLVEAVKWYRTAAQQGYAMSQHHLGIMYELGRGVSREDGEAAKWYRKAAEKGYAKAQNDLGFLYEKGRGVKQDYSAAVKWYSKAARQNDAMAQHNLGLMYENGRGISQDDTEAVKWYRKAAEAGYARAQNDLGVMYVKGRGVAQDFAQAVSWYRKAAEQDYAVAQDNLGDMYESGRGLTQDYSAAANWYRRAAEQGNSEAQNALGIMYERGEGVTRNIAEAVKWYREAAEHGNVYGLANLGSAYETGQGVPQDFDEAAKLYRRIEVIDARINKAYNGLGRIAFLSGKYDEAISQFEKSVLVAPGSPYGALWLDLARRRAGKPSQLREALPQLKMTGWPDPLIQLLLGNIDLESVRGQVSNDDEACELGFYGGEWLLAQGREDEARALLGEAANVCPVTFIERQPAISEFGALQLKFYRELAEKGSAEAQYQLGAIYLAGRFVAQDVDEAVKWFRKSADQHYAAAEFNLGLMHDQGRSLSQLETELVALLSARPQDDQLRFALGATQFIRTVEGMSQDMYRYGLQAPPDLQALLPFFRFPLPVNLHPEHLDYDKMRAVFQKGLDGFLRADATLTGLGTSEIKLPVALGLARLDLDGDGTASDRESLFALFNASLGGNRIPPDTGARFTISFDRGDAAWLRGYINLLTALMEFVLAHDGKASFDVSAQMLFPDAGLPNQALNRQSTRGLSDFDVANAADFIAAIHMMHWPVSEPARMASALGHLETMVTLSRQSWRFILAETDDDAEWIPSPRQKNGVLPNMHVTQQTVDGWMRFLDEFDAILKGQKLVPHWRLAKGINIRRVFLEPRTFDPILWAQGSGALPYLEDGPMIDVQAWRQIMGMFQGNFMGFAVWFN